MQTRRDRSSLPRAGTNMLADSTHAGAATPVDVHRMSLIVRRFGPTATSAADRDQRVLPPT